MSGHVIEGDKIGLNLIKDVTHASDGITRSIALFSRPTYFWRQQMLLARLNVIRIDSRIRNWGSNQDGNVWNMQ